MKKWITVLAVLMGLCLALVGCGGNTGKTKVTLDSTSVVLSGPGSVKLVRATVEGSEEKPEWSSSNPAVATVEGTELGGRITAVSAGLAVITAKVGDASATCEVTVEGATYFPTLTLSHSELPLFLEEEVTVRAQVRVGDKIDSEIAPEWTSSNPAVASVGQDGKVKGLSVGTATVTAKLTYEGELLEASVSVTVKDKIYFVINEENVRLALAALNPGEVSEQALTLSLRINGKEETPTGITWKSSDSETAAVDTNSGRVTAGEKAGTAEITASFVRNGATVEASVTVETFKSVLTAQEGFGDVDLTAKTLSIPLSELGMSGFEGEIEVRAGGKALEAELNSDILTADTEGVPFGEQNVEIEFPDRIVRADALFVTKILTTADDIKDLTAIAGGRDPVTEAYTGYFILGDNIDLGETPISAPLDSGTGRVGSKGFQGVFDGRGYTLSGGVFNGACGIFGTIGTNGIVKNLALSNADFNPAASVGSGLLAKYLFGTVQDVYISCELKGNTIGNSAIVYATIGAKVENVVVELNNSNTRPLNPQGSNNAVLVAYMPDAVTTFENVYAISNLALDGEVAAFDVNMGNQHQYEEIGNGVIAYLAGSEGMTFSDLSPEIWTIPNNGSVPYFTKSGARASYTVRHYVMEAETGAEWVVRDEETGFGMVGKEVTATSKSYPDRVFRMDKAPAGKQEANKGVILEDGSLVLECYYRTKWSVTVDRPAGTTQNVPALEMTGSPDNGHQFLDWVGDFAGVSNVWKYTTTELDSPANNNRLNLRWITPDELGTFSFFEVKVFAEDWSTVDIVLYSPTNSGQNAGDLSVAANAARVSDMLRLYDLEGNRVSKATDGEWLVLRMTTAGYAENYLFKIGNLAADSSFCIADPALKTETFAPELAVSQSEVSLTTGGTATLSASVLTGWKGETDEAAVILWKSSADAIASVAGGVVTANGAGTAVITAYIEYNGILLEATVNVTVTRAEIDSGKDFGDVDLSVGTLEVDLAADLGLTDYAGAEPTVTAGGIDCPATLSGGVLTVTVANVPYGAQAIRFEFADKIYTAEGLFVTKILANAEDIAKITECAGGRDPETDTYAGYFVLKNNIDLGAAEISAPVDTNEWRRDPARGFVGVFDGRGYAIANGVFTSGGLFGSVSRDGIVKNLSIVNARLTAADSNGSGVVARKVFGRLENISLSCTLEGGNFNSIGTIASVAAGATIKDTVVSVTFLNTRVAPNDNGSLISSNYDAVTTYENVYVITNQSAEGAAAAFGESNYDETKIAFAGNGLKVWFPTAQDKVFAGLSEEIWNVPEQGIPYFAKETGFIADYTVKHFVRTSDKPNEWTVRETEIRRGVIGNTVTAAGKNYSDRVSGMTDSNMSVPEGKRNADTGAVAVDGSLVLEIYYKSVAYLSVANPGTTAAKPVLEMGGNPRDGSQILDALGTFEGAENVWKLSATAGGGGSRLTLKNIALEEWDAQFACFEFKLYAADWSTVDIIPFSRTVNGKNSGDISVPANVTKMADMFKIYGADGQTELAQATDGEWITVRVTANGYSATSFFKIGLTAAGSFCIAEPKLVLAA